MGLLDNNIIVNVFSEAPPVTSQGFGTPLFLAAPGTLGAGFTERLRYYASATEVASDLASGDLSQVAADAVNAAIGQNPRASRIGVGRVDALVARVSTLTITYGADGDQFTATVNGIVSSYTAVGGDDADAVAAGLAAAMTTDLAAQPLTIGVATNVITITSTDAQAPFTLSSAVTGTGTIAEADTTPATSPESEVAAIFDEDGSWYAFTGDPAGYTDSGILSLAGWAQTNERLFLPQSDTAAIKTATTGHVGAQLKALAYDYTALSYHHDNAEYLALTWAAKTLAANLDAETTAWAYKTLSGVTVATGSDKLTTTNRSNLQANDVNFYADFFGRGSTWRGNVANGDFIDIRTTKDWTEARMRERLAQVFLDTSNRNSKVPYTDFGIQALDSEVRAVLLIGEDAGHFVAGTGNTSPPAAADVPLSDRQARRVRLEFSAQLAGAIDNAVVTGYVTLEDPTA